MIAGFWLRLDGIARNAAPGSITIMLVLVHVTPVHLPAFGHVAPDLAIMAIYYWSIHRPDLMPFSLVFAVGVLQGALTGGPLGLAPFVYLWCRWMVLSQRRFLVGKSFLVQWWGFAVLVVLAVALVWLGMSLLETAPMPAPPAAFHGLLTIAFYPLVAWLFIQVHRNFLRQA